MAEVTVFTAEHTQEIYDATVTEGEVNGGGHLILTTHGGTEIDAGLVRGADGTDGEDGAPGAPGADGTDGVDGADGEDGPIWQGAWSSVIAYLENDLVRGSDGSVYIAVAPSTNVNPTTPATPTEQGASGTAATPGGSFGAAVAQAFTVDTEMTISVLSIYCLGSLSGGTIVGICSGIGASPTYLGKNTLSGASATGWVDFTLDSSVTLVPGTTYYVLSTNGNVGASSTPKPSASGIVNSVGSCYYSTNYASVLSTWGLFWRLKGGTPAWETFAEHGTMGPTATLNPTSDVVPLTIKRGTDSSPAAKLLDIQNHAGTALAYFDYNGGLAAASVASPYALFTAMDATTIRATTVTDISSSDLNSLAYTGLFRGNSLTNSPDGTTNTFYVESLCLDGSNILQRATEAGTATPQIWARLKISGTWQSWFKVNTVITSWTGFSYQNSWTDYGSGWTAGQYRKVGDAVQLRGLIANGTINVVFATLPTGFRPAVAHLLPVIGLTKAAVATSAASAGTAHTHTWTATKTAHRLDITTGGSCTIDSGAVNDWFSLFGIEFPLT